jgi:hypothetical protein
VSSVQRLDAILVLLFKASARKANGGIAPHLPRVFDIANGIPIPHAMTLLRATLAVLALSAHVEAFAPSVPRAGALRSQQVATSPLQMADDKEDPTLMKSVLKKQIAYDESSGRFFETNINEEDCVPDEEFCMTDSSSGELIRLTQEEKERIFLDSLQVRLPAATLVGPSSNTIKEWMYCAGGKKDSRKHAQCSPPFCAFVVT